MERKTKLINLALATAAISLASVPVMSTAVYAHGDKVDCYGVNKCKGHGKCKTAHNECKGKNACKGKGMVKMSAKKCEKLHGTTEEPK